MKKQFTIFYSWQSDIPSNTSKIRKALKAAAKNVEKLLGNDIEILIDEDSRRTSGALNLANTIFNKIGKSDIFIGDVTIINKESKQPSRLTPNPNVLVELGFAISNNGWDRIIMVHDNSVNKAEELPFDIRGHRVMGLNFDDSEIVKKLTENLNHALHTIITDYDNILEKQNRFSQKYSDSKTFERLNVNCSESQLKESLNMITVDLAIPEEYLESLDYLKNFYRLSENHFIDDELDKKFLAVSDEVNNFLNLFNVEFFVDREHKGRTIYKALKEPKGNETWQQANERISKTQSQLGQFRNNALEKYTHFIKELKHKSVIS